jgi:hypothetical protein
MARKLKHKVKYRPGQTPKNNEVVRIFYEANEALIAKLAKHQIANKQ